MSAQQEEEPKRTIVVHVDINKTIIISDSAGGLSMETAVSDMVMGTLWGKINEEQAQKCEEMIANGELKTMQEIGEYRLRNCWTILSHEPRVLPPPQLSPNDRIYSFYGFMDYAYPYTPVERTGDDNAEYLQRQLLQNRRIKRVRRDFMNNFVKPGQVGERYADHYASLLDRLRVKRNDESSSTTAQVNEFVNLIPAFFNLVLYLEERRQKGDFEYCIVFRTFGDSHDVKSVVSEFNSFCLGQHERYPNTPATLREKVLDLTESKDNHTIGYMYTNSNHNDGTYLMLGSLNRPVAMDHVGIDPQRPIDSLIPADQQVTILHGAHNIYETIAKQSQSGSSMFLRDYWYWWSANREYSDSGKRLIVDPNDRSILQLFIDDNVMMPDWPTKGIVSLIDANSGEPLSQQQYINYFLWHSRPYEAVTDEHYFEKMIQQSERKHFGQG